MSSRQGISVTALLTAFAFAIAGYHPFAEDGGVYVPGVRKLLDPALYPTFTAFVTEHLRFSLFAPLVATLVRLTPFQLEPVLLMLYVASLWATLHAGWMVTVRLTSEPAARLGAVALLACWLTLPIAGTSLMLMDPYLTARSLTTPLTLVALAWTLDALAGKRLGWLLAALAIAAAAMLHPLMAGYGLAATLLLACTGARAASLRRYGPWTLLAVALLSAAVLQLTAAPESAAYRQIVHTRYYWFPFAWHWYEWLGLIAPLLLLDRLRQVSSASNALRWIARAALLLGGIALIAALLFGRESLHTHTIARLQPLRAFQIVYELMILLLGAWLGRTLLQQHVWRWVLLLAGMGVLFFAIQRQTYPSSSHIEWPWGASAATPRNPWEQAFLWARDQTPKDALFALDAHYITQAPHEDAQCFRAIAQRSALPDYSKDGGEAAITPALADAWLAGQTAQTGLESASDAERLLRLKPYRVSWIVLEQSSPTAWSCPYRNASVKVCQLPQ